MLVSRPSRSGKTTFVSSLLKRRKTIYNKPGGNIYWLYKVQNDDFVQNLTTTAHFYNEMVTMNWLKEHELPPNSTIVIDDMASGATEDTAQLFSVGSHHYNVNIIFLCQNLFSKYRYFRDISLNSTYVVLFKNVKDKLQITNFAKQFAPGRNKAFVEIFVKATKNPYTYLLLDNHQKTVDEHRILSYYLQENGNPVCLWLLKDKI